MQVKVAIGLGVGTRFELAIGENPRFAVGISILCFVIRKTLAFPVSAAILNSSPSLSHLFGDPSFELAMAENFAFDSSSGMVEFEI